MNRLLNFIGVELDAVSQKEKFVALLGGVCAISLLVFTVNHVCALPLGTGLIASMGASAVLLFAVPHGQLSQPWPVVAGHVVSAFIGVTCAKYLPGPEIAAGCAVGISIWVMHQLKCIHPPGGATALVAVLGGSVVHELGYQFVMMPVLVNALLMVLVAVGFNYSFKWRRYPAGMSTLSADDAAPAKGEPTHEDILHALRGLDLFVDVAEEDLVQLIKTVNEHAAIGRRQ